MPILRVKQGSIDTILSELSFVLPDFSAKDIDVADLLTWDDTNLPAQFQQDLLLSSFFGLIQTDLHRRVSVKKAEEEAFELDELQSLRDSNNDKLSDTRLKEQVKRSPQLRQIQAELLTLEHQLASVEVMVTMLNRKAVALNVLTAKSRAELSAGLHHS